MKRMIAAVAALMALAGAWAQYCPTQAGTVLKYVETVEEPEHVVKNLTMTVDSVYTEDSSTVVRLLNHTEIPGSLQTEDDEYTYARYTTADAPTKWLMLDASQVKQAMIDMIKSEVEGSGHMLGQEELAQLENAIRPRGELTLTLDPAAEANAKMPNASLRVNIETVSLSFHISNGKVLGKESVTVAAGTYDNCLKVTYVLKQNNPEMSLKFYVTDWYAPGIGLVKEEMKDKGGKLCSSQELTAVELP